VDSNGMSDRASARREIGRGEFLKRCGTGRSGRSRRAGGILSVNTVGERAIRLAWRKTLPRSVAPTGYSKLSPAARRVYSTELLGPRGPDQALHK
jgi:hypothetical protein